MLNYDKEVEQFAYFTPSEIRDMKSAWCWLGIGIGVIATALVELGLMFIF